jgi:hypothetical protein
VMPESEMVVVNVMVEFPQVDEDTQLVALA